MKSEIIRIRLTKEQKEVLQQRANRENRTLSDYIRLRIFKDKNRKHNPEISKKFKRDSSNSLTIRLTDEEKIVLDQRAKDAKLTPPEYIRQTSIYGTPVIDRQTLQQIYRELHSQGNNLNQFVKRINSRRQNQIDSKEANEILSKLKTSINNFNTLLMDINSRTR